MAEISLSAVCKAYGSTQVLHDVAIDIEDGQFCVFVGPSGCGKSTLLRVIAGLETVSDGEVRIGGEVVNDRTPPERGIAMVFQSYALYPHMSVYRNMAFGLKMGRAGKAETDQRVREAARVLQLEELLDRRPSQLSGGQRQRVAIGRAIVREPRVFLFDEPLSNLDAALRVQTRIEIARLHKRLGTTMVYVTHDQVEAMTLADRIVVLDGGRVAQVGAPLELYHAPRSRFVAGFIGSPKMNFIDGEIAQTATDGVTVRVATGEHLRVAVAPGTARPGDAVTIGVRPEHLLVAGTEMAATRSALHGTVDVVERLGDVSYLHVSHPVCNALLVAAVPGTAAARDGEEIALEPAAASAHLFARDGTAFSRLS